MGFISEYKKALNDEPAGEEYEVAGKKLVCTYCGTTHFWKAKAQLNTAFLTFLNKDWINRSATVYECTNCGHIEWFIEK